MSSYPLLDLLCIYLLIFRDEMHCTWNSFIKEIVKIVAENRTKGIVQKLWIKNVAKPPIPIIKINEKKNAQIWFFYKIIGKLSSGCTLTQLCIEKKIYFDNVTILRCSIKMNKCSPTQWHVCTWEKFKKFSASSIYIPLPAIQWNLDNEMSELCLIFIDLKWLKQAFVFIFQIRWILCESYFLRKFQNLTIKVV